MKKIIVVSTLIVSMLLFAVTASLPVFAADEYDLWVNGQRVTPDNLEIACGEGKATFDPEKSVLTLENANITVGADKDWLYSGIITFLDDLEIVIKGDCFITKTGGTGIDSYHQDEEYAFIPHNVKLTGDGKLTIVQDTQYYGYGLYVTGDLTVDGPTLDITSAAAGIWVNRTADYKSGKIDIEVTSENYCGLVLNNGNITVDGAEITATAKNAGLLLGNDKEKSYLTVNSGKLTLNAAGGIIAEPDPEDTENIRKLGYVTVNGGLLLLDGSKEATNIPADQFTLGQGVKVLYGEIGDKKCAIGLDTGDVDIPFDDLEDAVWGDANGDGSVTAADIVRLKKHLAGSGVAVSPGADADGSGTVDANDVVRLKRYFAEYDHKSERSSVRLGT